MTGKFDNLYSTAVMQAQAACNALLADLLSSDANKLWPEREVLSW